VWNLGKKDVKEGVAQTVERLFCMWETLTSNLSPTKKKKKT
jgi:hypothetical protein